MKHMVKVVFAGGGHAHLFSLKHAGRLIREGADVAVVGPDPYHDYSGMGPGLLSGRYGIAEIRIDIRSLIEKSGGRYIRGCVTGIDPRNRKLMIDTGDALDYDIASFNLGSRIAANGIQHAETESLAVKPIRNLDILRQSVLSLSAASPARILVIGTGPAGVEVAGNIRQAAGARCGTPEITLAGASESLLPRLPLAAGHYAMESLSARGIAVYTGCRISSLANGAARTQDGRKIPYDICVLATGTRPNHVFSGTGIETRENGALVVNASLQSRSFPNIFGGGDCIDFAPAPLDKVGVYAVRQAPVIFHNIRALIRGERLRRFVPQKKYLQILNLGDNSAIFVYKPFVWKGRWVFGLKHRIDRRFISRYHQ